MKNEWFPVEDDDCIVHWHSSLIEKIWIGKTMIEIWIGNNKYAFFSKKEQKDPEYTTVETSGLSVSEFKKLKTYLEKLVGITSIKNKSKGE